MNPIDAVAARERDLAAQQQSFVRALVVRTERPTSARAGDTAIVDALGGLTGFVGGTCVEASVREFGLEVLETGAPLLLRVRAGQTGRERFEGGIEVHNACLSGGSVDIFLEPVVPAPLVAVIGEQPVAAALVRLGETLGYRMAATTDEGWEPEPGTAAVVVAGHGKGEEPALERALRAGVPYVGLVASGKRGAAVVASLDVPDELRARVRTPAGLKLGGTRPEDIALGVLAELVQVRAMGGGVFTAPESSGAGHGDGGHGGHGHAGHVGHDHADHTGHDHGPAAAGPGTAIDPVCKMTVIAAAPTLSAEHEGRTIWFCAEGCRRAFLADPGRYLDAA
jgi:xanthine dehydrogenase accessory factor